MRTVIRAVMWFFTPDFWRRACTGKVRVEVYLSSGQSVKFNVTKWTATLGKENAKYRWEGSAENIHFRPTDIVGWREVRWF